VWIDAQSVKVEVPEYQNGLALAPRDESRLKPDTLPSRIKKLVRCTLDAYRARELDWTEALS